MCIRDRCIRIPNAISATFFNLVGLGQSVFVWDGIKEPEAYGSQSGLWDWADPNYTTTTSSTTTTTTTTVAPATTAKPVTPPTAPPVATPAGTTTTVPAVPPATPPPAGP